VPLTVFAFLGGALAIGVGFGSQNILNNFISGLIILAERPIRVGDLVEIDGLYGNIQHVGARSTRVKTGSNLEIIVPNSRFLENNVSNWTLSNDEIRAVVGVGVAYGSPTREVSRLLRKAVTDNPEIRDEPAPIVLFNEFGDNALHFEVHFWIKMRTIMQRQRMESEVRHTIDDLLDDAGITIAFPQRDVHIDSVKPLEINVRNIGDETVEFPRSSDAAFCESRARAA
jgi:small-conductance mechanosensitive channel